MKQELEKYLKSQEQINKQTIHIREFGMKLAKAMIIICIAGVIVGIIGAILSI